MKQQWRDLSYPIKFIALQAALAWVLAAIPPWSSGILLLWSVPLLATCLWTRITAVRRHRLGEPVVAYRAWDTHHGDLISIAQGTKWLPGAPMMAGTLLFGGGWNASYLESLATTVPTFSGGTFLIEGAKSETQCEVGVYAVKSVIRAHAASKMFGHVIGEVNLWGHIVEHEDGYRAQFAYPRRLIGGDGSVMALAAKYGVPHVTWPRFVAGRLWDGVKEAGARVRRRAGLLAGGAAGASAGETAGAGARPEWAACAGTGVEKRRRVAE